VSLVFVARLIWRGGFHRRARYPLRIQRKHHPRRIRRRRKSPTNRSCRRPVVSRQAWWHRRRRRCAATSRRPKAYAAAITATCNAVQQVRNRRPHAATPRSSAGSFSPLSGCRPSSGRPRGSGTRGCRPSSVCRQYCWHRPAHRHRSFCVCRIPREQHALLAGSIFGPISGGTNGAAGAAAAHGAVVVAAPPSAPHRHRRCPCYGRLRET
jgi:hypothetical protein